MKQKTILAILAACIALSAMAFSSVVNANEVTLDPSIPGQTTLTITCNFNLTREDGTPMTIGDIAKASYYISTNGGPFINADADTPTCRQVFDMTKLADAEYVYAVTETDIDGRESVHSLEMVTAIVKRLAPPSAPGGVSGAVE